MSSRARRRAQLWGELAELQCVFWLICKGYSILARNHRNPYGEIDVIARRGRVLAFVEVKARRDDMAAIEAVDALKRSRTQQAALRFVASHPNFADHGLRFDVMVVTSPWRIKHLTDAWRP